jgi:hypothetical protein
MNAGSIRCVTDHQHKLGQEMTRQDNDLMTSIKLLWPPCVYAFWP